MLNQEPLIIYPRTPHLAVLTPRLSEALADSERAPDQAQPLFGCLAQLLRLFASLSAGLARHLDPGRAEIEALASGLDRPLKYERLLRFCINLLLNHPSDHPCRTALLLVFFPPATADAQPFVHTGWLQLGSEASPLPPLSRWPLDEAGNSQPLGPEVLLAYREVLDAWLRAAADFVPAARWRLDEESPRRIVGWKYAGGEVELMPPCLWEAERTSPTAPQLRVNWSGADLERLTRELESAYPPLPTLEPPNYLLDAATSWMATQSSGYLLLEGPDGSGKSLAAAALADRVGPTLATVNLSVAHHLRGDSHSLVEQIDEQLTHSGSTGLLPLGPAVLSHLNLRQARISHGNGGERGRTPAELQRSAELAPTPASKLQSYLAQLVARNGQRFLLTLDGLDESSESGDGRWSLADYLPDRLPEGVFLLLTFHLPGCSARLRRRLAQLLEGGAGHFSMEVRSPAYRRWCERLLTRSGATAASAPPEFLGTLTQARLVGQARSRGLLPFNAGVDPAGIYGALLRAGEERWGEPLLRLLLVLSTVQPGVPLRELGLLGFAPELLSELCSELPALMLAQPSHDVEESGDWILGLAHESLRQHLFEHFGPRYSRTCEQLAARAAEALTATADERGEAGDLPGRLEALYRWLLDAGDMALSGSVLRHAGLRTLRNQVCAQLDRQGHLSRKLSLLHALRLCLEASLELDPVDELREELAWAHNARGLTYLHLGQFESSLEALAEAEDQFNALLEQQGTAAGPQRAGLAAVWNRRSEALRALGQEDAAAHAAQVAVDAARQAQGDLPGGRGEVALARACVQRARCSADRQAFDDALSDLLQALLLLDRGGTRSEARREQWVEALAVRAAVQSARQDPAAARADLERALELLPSEDNLVAWSEAARCTLSLERARALRRLGLRPEAPEAYDDAVSAFSHAVIRGRLDLRAGLGHACQERAELHAEAEDWESALPDFTRALATWTQLAITEDDAALRSSRAEAYAGRAACLEASGHRREAWHDLDRALEELGQRSGRATGGRGPAALLSLGQLYARSARLAYALGEAEAAAERASGACRYLEGFLSPDFGDMLRLQALAWRDLGRPSLAWEAVTRALETADGEATAAATRAELHSLRASLARLLGDPAEAARELGRAIELWQHAPGGRRQQADALQLRAQLAIDQGHAEDALEDLGQALDVLEDSDPDRSLALYSLRADLWNGLDQPDMALLELEQATAGDPARAGLTVWVRLLEQQAAVGLWNDFFTGCSELLASAPPSKLPGGSLERLLQHLEAAPAANEAERLELGVTLARALDDAATLIRRLRERALQRHAAGRITEALEDLSEAIAVCSGGKAERLMLLTMRAEMLLEADLSDRAARDLDAALKLAVEADTGWDVLAALIVRRSSDLRRRGQGAQAVAELTSALASIPLGGSAASADAGTEALGWLHLSRALALDSSGDPRARFDFREAAQRFSEMPQARPDLLAERLRCRLRLLHLTPREQTGFLSLCAEDALVCWRRLQNVDREVAARWLLPCLATLPLAPPDARWSVLLEAGLELVATDLTAQSQLTMVAGSLLTLLQSASLPALARALLRICLEAPEETLAELLHALHWLSGHPDVEVDIGVALDALASEFPPPTELQVLWNNAISGWAKRSNEELRRARVDRAALQALRLW